MSTMSDCQNDGTISSSSNARLKLKEAGITIPMTLKSKFLKVVKGTYAIQWNKRFSG